MERFFYEDPDLLYPGKRRYLVFDRQRGAAEEQYALAVCARHDDAERIVGALNADVTRHQRDIVYSRVIDDNYSNWLYAEDKK